MQNCFLFPRWINITSPSLNVWPLSWAICFKQLTFKTAYCINIYIYQANSCFNWKTNHINDKYSDLMCLPTSFRSIYCDSGHTWELRTSCRLSLASPGCWATAGNDRACWVFHYPELVWPCRARLCWRLSLFCHEWQGILFTSVKCSGCLSCFWLY